MSSFRCTAQVDNTMDRTEEIKMIVGLVLNIVFGILYALLGILSNRNLMQRNTYLRSLDFPTGHFRHGVEPHVFPSSTGSTGNIHQQNSGGESSGERKSNRMENHHYRARGTDPKAVIEIDQQHGKGTASPQLLRLGVPEGLNGEDGVGRVAPHPQASNQSFESNTSEVQGSPDSPQPGLLQIHPRSPQLAADEDLILEQPNDGEMFKSPVRRSGVVDEDGSSPPDGESPPPPAPLPPSMEGESVGDCPDGLERAGAENGQSTEIHVTPPSSENEKDRFRFLAKVSTVSTNATTTTSAAPASHEGSTRISGVTVGVAVPGNGHYTTRAGPNPARRPGSGFPSVSPPLGPTTRGPTSATAAGKHRKNKSPRREIYAKPAHPHSHGPGSLGPRSLPGGGGYGTSGLGLPRYPSHLDPMNSSTSSSGGKGIGTPLLPAPASSEGNLIAREAYYQSSLNISRFFNDHVARFYLSVVALSLYTSVLLFFTALVAPLNKAMVCSMVMESRSSLVDFLMLPMAVMFYGVMAVLLLSLLESSPDFEKEVHRRRLWVLSLAVLIIFTSVCAVMIGLGDIASAEWIDVGFAGTLALCSLGLAVVLPRRFRNINKNHHARRSRLTGLICCCSLVLRACVLAPTVQAMLPQQLQTSLPIFVAINGFPVIVSIQILRGR